MARKEIKEDKRENRFELMEPPVSSTMQAHNGEDSVDEVYTTVVDVGLSKGSTQAHHHAEDLWEAMPSTQVDDGERIVERVNMEDVAKEGAALKLSKSQGKGAGGDQVGLREARGDSCALGCPYIPKIRFELMPAKTACLNITISPQKNFRHITSYLTECTTVLCWSPC